MSSTHGTGGGRKGRPDGDDVVDDTGSAERGRTTCREVQARQEDAYGGIKWGAAFFGWLTAMGTAVLLTAALGAIGAAVGLGTLSSVGEATSTAQQEAGTVGIVSGIALLVVLFLAYFCGGYVAGRMARFNGAKQGMAVWVWALLIALVVAIATVVAGSEFNVLSRLDGFPRIPVSEGDLTTGGIVAAVAALAVTLAGAVVGGLSGMRYHRKIDKAGLGR